MAYVEPGTSSGTPVEYDPGNPLKQKPGTPVVYNPPDLSQPGQGPGTSSGVDWAARMRKMQMAAAAEKAKQSAQQAAQAAQHQPPMSGAQLGLGSNPQPTGTPDWVTQQQAKTQPPGYQYPNNPYNPNIPPAIPSQRAQWEAMRGTAPASNPNSAPNIGGGYRQPVNSGEGAGLGSSPYAFPPIPNPSLAAQMNALKSSNINGPTQGGYQYPPTIGPTIPGYQRPPNVPQREPNGPNPGRMAPGPNQTPALTAAGQEQVARNALDASRNYSFRMQDYARDYGNTMSHLTVQAPKVVGQPGQGGYGYYPYGGWGGGGWGGGWGGGYSGTPKSWFMNLVTLKLGI
jgi:hypothetical protein